MPEKKSVRTPKRGWFRIGKEAPRTKQKVLQVSEEPRFFYYRGKEKRRFGIGGHWWGGRWRFTLSKEKKREKSRGEHATRERREEKGRRIFFS